MSSALQEIRKAEDAIYEIQELRHTTASSQTSQINELFASLEARVERIRELVSRTHAAGDEDVSSEVGHASDGRAQEAWAAFEKRWNTLRDEMKEDGWLVRFRTTAEQAEAMMDSLAKSATEMVQTVPQHEAGLVADEGYAQLVRTLKGHLAMRSTYASSISKILKMMDRSLADRATKNGEALRRHGDMTARWTTLQHDLRAVEGRARIVLEQQAPHDSGVSSAPKGLKGAGGDGAMADSLEMLAESLSLHDDSPRSRTGYDSPGSRHTRVHTSTLQLHPQYPQHPPREPASVASSSLGSRTNTSDIHSARSLLSPPVAGSRYPSLGSAAHPGGPPTLRRRVSQTSLVSTTTAATNSERPRWNGSTKVHHPASASALAAAGEQTPGTAKRRLTMTGAATPSRPSRSGATTPSSAMPSVTPSKIPAPRARPSLSNRPSMAGATNGSLTPRRSIPGLAVSTTSSRISLSHPSGRDDDIPPVPPLPARTPSRQTNRPSLANDAAGMPPPYHTNRTSATATVTPHRPRQSLARGPPSAYRPGSVSSPQGSGVPPLPRPSSRMSTGAASVAGSAYGYGNTPHDDLVPFVPSKYDLLDGCVAQLLADNAFEHFVARVDPPLKKGQRRGENEEWKGTYVFGSAGERGTPVKMMQLASRDGGKVSKVLARRAGQWVPLKEVLDERKEKYDEVF